ncbi:hypothetical protein Hamer_G021458 [Homarus americanus]|uniref:Uncharacterized protein n=1 Tax=Homarus americanus TaxID=6706 RepID=A0A8J5JHJ3_HOMAM|nr:hypothetical protein Hamer_G021458 [Homarus americanus]
MGEEEDERRGSVTGLLQSCVDLYTPPSPRHHPPPEPDCWEEGRRTLRQDKTKPLPNPRPIIKKDDPPLLPTPPQKKNERSDATAEMTVGKKKTSPGHLTRKTSTSALKKTDGGGKVGKHKGKVTVGPDKQVESGKSVTEVAAADDPAPKPRPIVMGGCSGAYQRAVREVRGATPDDSVVLLGLPGDDNVILHPTQPDQLPINIRSFTVAMAASKMKALGLRKGATTKQVVSAGRRDDHSERASSRKPESQPILAADNRAFSITFDKPKKVRVVRVNKMRRKSLIADVLPPQEDEEPAREEAEWLEWRRVHDRVEQWLRDNTKVDPDESHVVAMLLDPDTKKAALFRS